MKATSDSRWARPVQAGSLLLPLLLFYLVLTVRIPSSISRYFYFYSIGLFFAVLVLYYLAFRLPEPYRQPACFGLTLLLFALALSYRWTSGISDNKAIAGFLPYKDGAGYYLGSQLILNGLTLENTLQAGWRPLFPGFLASVLALTGGNLKIALALLVLLAGIGSYLATRRVYDFLGALPAGLFITFLYFFIQPLLGLTMTELLGFTFGCFAFALLWSNAFHPRWPDLLLGLFSLVLAMSVRAGTFFMLPLIALWAGRIFRGRGLFSWRAFAAGLMSILLVFLIANWLYVRMVGVPQGRAFGNFSYSLYGQVQGGTGWHRAIEDLATRDPDVIYRAAFQFFQKHPLSLFIGIAKSYWDFFLAGDRSIFAFDIYRPGVWLNYLAWAAAVLLLVRGLLTLGKNIRWNISLLLIAGFLGILLSIPFLPPIDGGSRFYAGTAPFFFIVPVIGLAGFPETLKGENAGEQSRSDRIILFSGSILLSLLTLVVPLLILNGKPAVSVSAPACAPDETPFVIQVNPGSYVDLVAGNQACGLAPAICLDDFEQNGLEKSVDDFYQKIDSLARGSRSNVRLLPALNLVDARIRYFLISQDVTPTGLSTGQLSGCAVENNTSNLGIYHVKSISSDQK
jgi:hypothetical protein